MTLYRHFGSKEELFKALVASMCDYIRIEAEQAHSAGEGRSITERLRAEATAFTAALTQPDALAAYRLIVSDGWRHPALARLFEQSGLAVLRTRIVAVLGGPGEPQAPLAVRASGFVNLALGDAYLEASIGLEDPDRREKFAAQIETAIRFATAE